MDNWANEENVRLVMITVDIEKKIARWPVNFQISTLLLEITKHLNVEIHFRSGTALRV